MRYLRRILLCVFALFQTAGCAIVRGDFTGFILPFDYGQRSAKTGEQRYDVLYKTHCAAIERGVNVDYARVGEVELSIPKDAKSIPLTDFTDFKGTRFVFHNFTKMTFMFELSQSARWSVYRRCACRWTYHSQFEGTKGEPVPFQV